MYGTPVTLPISEDHPTVLLSLYGASKLACEHYARLYSELHGIGVVIARPLNVYSKRQDPSNSYNKILNKFTKRVRAGKAPPIFGDGSQMRDYVHASDVARRMVVRVTAPERSRMLIANLSIGRETSVIECADSFLQVTGLQGMPEFQPARAGELTRSVADTSRPRSIGCLAHVNQAAGIEELTRV